jgi:hypothetical protein
LLNHAKLSNKVLPFESVMSSMYVFTQLCWDRDLCILCSEKRVSGGMNSLMISQLTVGSKSKPVTVSVPIPIPVRNTVGIWLGHGSPVIVVWWHCWGSIDCVFTWSIGCCICLYRGWCLVFMCCISFCISSRTIWSPSSPGSLPLNLGGSKTGDRVECSLFLFPSVAGG